MHSIKIRPYGQPSVTNCIYLQSHYQLTEHVHTLFLHHLFGTVCLTEIPSSSADIIKRSLKAFLFARY